MISVKFNIDLEIKKKEYNLWTAYTVSKYFSQ